MSDSPVESRSDDEPGSAAEALERALHERRRDLATALAQVTRAATLPETGLDLNLRDGELRLLEQLAGEPAAATGWRGRIADSILVALIWNDLAGAETAAIRDGRGPSAMARALPRLIEECRETLRGATDRLDGTGPAVEQLIRRAEQRLRSVSESVTWVTSEVAPIKHTPLPSLAGRAHADAPPHERSPAGAAELDALVAPTLAALTAPGRAPSGESLRKAVLELAGGTRPALTETEITALGAVEPAAPGTASAERELWRLTSALTVKIGADLSVLQLERAPSTLLPGGDPSALGTDLDAAGALLEVLEVIHQVTKNQGQVRTAAAVDVVADRLASLRTALGAVVDPHRAPQRFGVDLDPEQFRATRTVAPRTKTLTASPPPRPAAVRRLPATLGRGRAVAIAASVLCVLVAIVLGIREARPYLVKPGPTPISRDALATHLPGATVLEPTATERARGLVRIQLAPGATQSDPTLLRKQVLDLCQYLASSRYERAELVDSAHRAVARWENGFVTFDGNEPPARTATP